MYIDDKITWKKRDEIDKLVDQFIHILRLKDLKYYNLNYVYRDWDKRCWVIGYSSGGYMESPTVYAPYRKYVYFFTEERLREFLKCA